jgi:hypothetical protein
VLTYFLFSLCKLPEILIATSRSGAFRKPFLALKRDKNALQIQKRKSFVSEIYTHNALP